MVDINIKKGGEKMFDTAISTQNKISWNLFPDDAQALIEQNKNGDDLLIISIFLEIWLTSAEYMAIVETWKMKWQQRD